MPCRSELARDQSECDLREQARSYGSSCSQAPAQASKATDLICAQIDWPG